jgi:creatinine amidohydrolase
MSEKESEMKKGFLFEQLTWHEVNEAVKAGKVAILPVGTLEDHGPHLPVDTDARIVESVCQLTAERIPDELVLLPTVKYGYSPHHIDFPGTITVPPPNLRRGWGILTDYLLSITCSLAHHGFRKILMVNGHGSNRPLVDMAGRLTVLEYPTVQCGYISWWELEAVQNVFEDIVESAVSCHAGEVETSMYLAIDEALVYMDKAEADLSFDSSPHFWSNLVNRKPSSDSRAPIHINSFWSMDTKNGVKGDPTRASREKGYKMLAAATEELAEAIREFRTRAIRERVKHQASDCEGSEVRHRP